MNLDAALETYVEESRELLQQMEDLLLAASAQGSDPDAVNAMFRAAHTIKGSAGLFGLDDIVGFTHGVESVMDRVRDGELELDEALQRLLLECCDYMGLLVGDAANGSRRDANGVGHGQALQVRLRRYLAGAPPASDDRDGAPAAASAPGADGLAGHPHYWHISARFGRDVLRNGMDPLSFIRYLGTLGNVVAVRPRTHELPPAAELDPESCYLGFEIGFVGQTDKASIESVFEFVRDDCELRILPPESTATDYINLIRQAPGDELRLGELLLRCGAITPAELEAALDAQRLQAGPAASTAARPLGEVLVALDVVHPPVVQAALDQQRQARENRAQESRFIRVDSEKLDVLINRIGELVIAGAGISIAARKVGGAELLECASTLATLVEDVRDSALQLRMVQIGATFNRFQRVVHDVSRDLGKEITLQVSGGETELDKTMVERIGDPLMHLVRNAMDHGIEPAEQRLARGKPAAGTLRLSACHDAGSIVIEVSDDGGGLSRERILAKAIERGLVSATDVLSDHEVWDLIFAPGFSTAAEVSRLSGRGVGMDVVRSNVIDLRGTVELDSREGHGTTVRIRLPLTLAIISGFLVRVGSAMFVVPLDMVEECVELTAQARDMAQGHRFVNLRGRVLPFVDVREMFGIDGERGQRDNILVVRYGAQRAGLLVDELMGEAQTVIKPLGRLFAAVEGIGGSTILGDGRIALILDIPGLMETAHAQAAPQGGSEGTRSRQGRVRGFARTR